MHPKKKLKACKDLNTQQTAQGYIQKSDQPSSIKATAAGQG